MSEQHLQCPRIPNMAHATRPNNAGCYLTRTGRPHRRTPSMPRNVHISRRSLYRVCAVLLLCMSTALALDDCTLPASLVAPGDTSVLFAPRQGTFTEGPTMRSDGVLFFTEPSSSGLFMVTPDGTVSRPSLLPNKANGLVVDAANRVRGVEKGRVWAINPDGSSTTLVATYGTGNDLTLTDDGGMFVTMPSWSGLGKVYYIAADGAQTLVLDSVADFPNGIEYVAERNKVYIAYTQSGYIVSYSVSPDYRLTEDSVLAMVGSPDGFALDSSGNFWIANFTNGRIEVIDSAGAFLGYLHNQEFGNVANCCFGGPGSSRLYIASAAGIYTVDTQVKGRSTRGAMPDAAAAHTASAGKLRSARDPAIASGVYRLNGQKKRGRKSGTFYGTEVLSGCTEYGNGAPQ
ncbi:MAG: hypothetical protein GF331_09290 [Chitinivibrionales bacterium]|nr:hypothetical protein [Chitinivibrionales bacterium]